MPAKHNLAALVSDASDDITPPGPLRRGGGLNSMIGGTAPPPSIEPEISITRRASLPESQQAGKEVKPKYPPKTYRLEPTSAARLKAWAALNKRTEQAIVEELIIEFLERVGG